MEEYDIIIVGSGISSAAAALQLCENGRRPCLLDAGLDSESPPFQENLYSYAESNDTFDMLIGEDYNGLRNLFPQNEYIPAKLAAPRMQFVTQSPQGVLGISETQFSAIISLARGGLANAWGAGLYEYDDSELAGFPISASDLKPYYEKLGREIGISGELDDLSPFFGDSSYLQSPLKLSKNAQRLMSSYGRKKNALNKQGIYLGRPRLGILSQPLQDRDPIDYHNLEFWQPRLPYIYTPAFTISRLQQQNKIDYKSNFLVKSWKRQKHQIVVEAEHLQTQTIHKFRCNKLLIGAGPINTAKIVLSSLNDFQTQLPLFDNPAFQFPLIFPEAIGRRLETDAFGLTQLNLVHESERLNERFQGSILEITSPARSEFFSSLPMSARDNLRLIKYVLPAMMVMQLFLPANQRAADVQLQPDGTLTIKGYDKPDFPGLLKTMIKAFFRLGVLTHKAVMVDVTYGHGMHYGGTLPMKLHPSRPFECTRNGELFGEPGVFIIDGSLFPHIPAKNYSFTVMANAMRIAFSLAKGA